MTRKSKQTNRVKLVVAVRIKKFAKLRRYLVKHDILICDETDAVTLSTANLPVPEPERPDPASRRRPTSA